MPRRNHLSTLFESAPVILPSLLLCDFGNLEREVARLEEAGVKALHLDVMDGRFVPNLTYGMPIVSALRRLTDMPLDVHLMIEEPQRYVQHFFDAGADIITFHVEAVEDPQPVIDQIHALGAAAGVALNPATPVSAVEPILADCDLVLVMSVEAGFGGQSFQTTALEKLRRLRTQTAPSTMLEVDGGVNAGTIAKCARAGAQLMVVGSAIFGHDSYSSAVTQLTHTFCGDGDK
jgi:ribulose-phosphate 3-epimerase